MAFDQSLLLGVGVCASLDLQWAQIGALSPHTNLANLTAAQSSLSSLFSPTREKLTHICTIVYLTYLPTYLFAYGTYGAL